MTVAPAGAHSTTLGTGFLFSIGIEVVEVWKKGSGQILDARYLMLDTGFSMLSFAKSR